ncbi:hypothetical protein [Rhizobium leguminosarum]|uniref:hypothetical protein n=1 Tax=Rhizobium leguminosarum TaxID=384 RepID=UPI001F19221F|nr:hypothetical protein [Rhizobium leguminosarum]UIJ82227.1 hypothetical protein LZK78_25320 [Rhizobium leguminosarum]
MTELANFIRLNEDGTYLDGVVRWKSRSRSSTSLILLLSNKTTSYELLQPFDPFGLANFALLDLINGRICPAIVHGPL